MQAYWTWLGIAFCLSQSAIFSGLNLAYFSMSRLRLEIQVANGNSSAARILKLRHDSNFLLTTILWGNVGINVLLTLLSNSVMTGVVAFAFSTFVITLGGEIAPQAYFSRNALRMAALLAPLIRFYQLLLLPIAKPSAWILDMWLGRENLQFFQEKELHHLIYKHIESEDSEVDAVEGIGALNFLAIDDVPVSMEGELVLPESVFDFPLLDGRPQFFSQATAPEQAQRELALRVAAAGCHWIIIVDGSGPPSMVLDADAYLREVYSPDGKIVDPLRFCHRPVLVNDPATRLGSVIALFKSQDAAQSDLPLKQDVILLWSDERRIITGADILGRLFKGIGFYSSLQASVGPLAATPLALAKGRHPGRGGR